MTAPVVRETAFDEIFDSQRAFRVLLGALSRPGIIHRLPEVAYTRPPREHNPHLLTVIKTLCDPRVTIGVCPESDEAWARYLEVNTRAARAGVEAADYVVADGGCYVPVTARLKGGTLEEPESSATLVLSAARITAEADGGRDGCVVTLRGPGVRGAATVRVAGLDPRYVEDLAGASLVYPFGVDALVVDWSGAVIGIPRSNRPEVA